MVVHTDIRPTNARSASVDRSLRLHLGENGDEKEHHHQTPPPVSSRVQILSTVLRGLQTHAYINQSLFD